MRDRTSKSWQGMGQVGTISLVQATGTHELLPGSHAIEMCLPNMSGQVWTGVEDRAGVMGREKVS